MFGTYKETRGKSHHKDLSFFLVEKKVTEERATH